ncbi:unnamed protein product, partial [Rotaria sp. Silwood1]
GPGLGPGKIINFGPGPGIKF